MKCLSNIKRNCYIKCIESHYIYVIMCQILDSFQINCIVHNVIIDIDTHVLTSNVLIRTYDIKRIDITYR